MRFAVSYATHAPACYPRYGVALVQTTATYRPTHDARTYMNREEKSIMSYENERISYQQDWVPDSVEETHWSKQPNAPTLASVMEEQRRKELEANQQPVLEKYVPPAPTARELHKRHCRTLDAEYRRTMGLPVDAPKTDTPTSKVASLEAAFITAAQAFAKVQNRDFMKYLIDTMEEQ
jgi:hypothetical protein